MTSRAATPTRKQEEHQPRITSWIAAAVLLVLATPISIASSLDPPAAIASAKASSVSVPLDSCPVSQADNGVRLSAGLGTERTSTEIIRQGERTSFGGRLVGPDGRGVPGGLICIYAGVTTEEANELEGIVATDAQGRYEFLLPRGPSRNLTAVFRSGQGRLTAWGLLQVRAIPTLRFARGKVRDKHFVHFSGRIPGPHNDRVVVVLQVKQGKGWRVFRRYSTRNGGRYRLKYRFTRTFRPTTYVFRAQVLGAPGYPYLSGNSKPRKLHVLP